MPLLSIADVILVKAIIRNAQLEYLDSALFLLGWGSRREENGDDKCPSAGAACYATLGFPLGGARGHHGLLEKAL